MIRIEPTLTEGKERKEMEEERKKGKKRQLEEKTNRLEEDTIDLEIAKVELELERLELQKEDIKEAQGKLQKEVQEKKKGKEEQAQKRVQIASIPLLQRPGSAITEEMEKEAQRRIRLHEPPDGMPPPSQLGF